MMADAKQIEQELREYLEKEDHLRKSDKLPYLMAIINKHFEIDKLDHMVNHYDLMAVISNAKSNYAGSTMPMYVSRKEVHNSEINHVLIIEAFVGYLNKNKLLKRLVKFDFRR
jgi:hypothetical protein